MTFHINVEIRTKEVSQMDLGPSRERYCKQLNTGSLFFSAFL